jgi:ribonucleoside-diphosphate reductase alpha subunit
MKVVKRNGRIEEVKLEKITKRVDKLSYGLNVGTIKVSQKVIAGIYDGITSTEIDQLLSETAAVLGVEHPDYSKLAARIAVSSLHKSTKGFYQTMKDLYKEGSLSEDFIDLIRKYGKQLEKIIDYDRDLEFEYHGYKTLEKSYLLKINGAIVERPQHLFMRVALGICGDNLEEVEKLYNHLSLKEYTHATPTLFNTGTKRQQMSSCFLIAMEDDSIEGIFNTAKECALISKNAGGIGLHVHNVRASGTPIKGTNGTSNGIVPMLKVFNSIATYVDQGGGKRKGSFAIYLEPWHADIEHFLELKKNTGKEEFRARDLFYALWTPDLFMQRVEEDGMWTLMCPHQCPGLSDVYGKDFDKLYTQYEKEGKGLKTVKARELWGKVLESQIETGTPYILYKDSCNEKSNQKNIGVIKSSNLCFSKDTVVAIADGSNGKTIKELADWSQGIKKFPVYSAAEGDVLIKGRRGGGKLRLGPWKDEIKWAVAFKTGTKKVVELTMDNGDKIKCTPDHELALAHGGYVEASKSLNKELQSFFTYTPQDRKTPYRHINSISNGRSKQHIKIWEFHNDYNKGHIDHIQNNLEFPDHIDNLQSLKIEDHLNKNSIERKGFLNSYHKIKNKEIYLENKKIQSRGTGNNTYSGIDNFELIEIGKKIYKEYGLITKGVYLDYSEKNNLNLPKSFSKYRFNGDWSLYYSYCMGLKDYNGEFEVGPQDYIKTQDLDEKRINQLKDEFYFTDENDVLCKKGIKVINIEEIGEEDVYDLTVEDNHNFYIITSTQDKKYNNCRGILVHNCTEILEVSTPEETAVCNLASLSLPSFIKEKVNGKNTLYYDYEALHEVVKTATRNLNLVIDKNYYPTEKTHKSNMRHRPIGLGVQGLANVFFKFKIAYDSEEAKQLNKNIFETIYHAALEESCSLAEKYGAYETFAGSPASKGILQYDMWGVTPSDRYDWSALKAKIKAKGLRNSLLVAPMPTASTASIFGNVEAFEAQTSNIYKRQVLAGEYVMVNSDLIRDLEEIGLWNENIRNKIIEENGSVQNIPEIPTHIKEVYKTIWEISQKVVIDMAADRGAFIDQSQSLNLWLAKPNFGNLNSMHFYAWKKGLKTGMYYLRSKPALQAQKVTTKIDTEVKEFTNEEALVCSIENPEDCIACGS